MGPIWVPQLFQPLHLLPGTQGTNGSSYGQEDMVARAGELAEIGFTVHPHQLGHACGYYLASKGQDTRAIQSYMGHRNIQHTVSSERLMGDAKTWTDSVSIIPIEAHGKRPLIPWTEYQRRRATREEREEWKKKFPGCNWGLVTGRVSPAALDAWVEHRAVKKCPTCGTTLPG